MGSALLANRFGIEVEIEIEAGRGTDDFDLDFDFDFDLGFDLGLFQSSRGQCTSRNAIWYNL